MAALRSCNPRICNSFCGLTIFTHC